MLVLFPWAPEESTLTRVISCAAAGAARRASSSAIVVPDAGSRDAFMSPLPIGSVADRQLQPRRERDPLRRSRIELEGLQEEREPAELRVVGHGDDDRPP